MDTTEVFSMPPTPQRTPTPNQPSTSNYNVNFTARIYKFFLNYLFANLCLYFSR